MVRAKFMVTEILGETVTMECVYSPEVPEDEVFMKATPWGVVKMGIDNPEALKQFEVGKAYYADFTPAK